jgi:hypothetical protein
MHYPKENRKRGQRPSVDITKIGNLNITDKIRIDK